MDEKDKNKDIIHQMLSKLNENADLSSESEITNEQMITILLSIIYDIKCKIGQNNKVDIIEQTVIQCITDMNININDIITQIEENESEINQIHLRFDENINTNISNISNINENMNKMSIKLQIMEEILSQLMNENNDFKESMNDLHLICEFGELNGFSSVFIGRKNDLQFIHNKLNKNINNENNEIIQDENDGIEEKKNENDCFIDLGGLDEILVISGMGGIGKSRLCLQYGETYKSDYDIIYVIESEELDQIFTKLKGLGEKLNVISDNDKQISKDELIERIKRGLRNKNSLIIFDNMENNTLLTDYISYLQRNENQLKRNHILITTRNEVECIDDDYNVYKLGLFSDDDDVIEYCKTRLKTIQYENDENCTELGRVLQHLPLALKIATGYIRKKKINIIKFIENLNDDKLNEFNDALTKVFVMTRTEEILHNDKICNDLLILSSYMNPDCVYVPLLLNTLKLINNSDEESDSDIFRDSYCYFQAIH